VAVVIMPIMVDREEYPWAAEHERVGELARARGLAVLDLAAPLRRELLAGRQLLQKPRDKVHPNAAGADLIASSIADWLLESPLRAPLVR
jgi:lysophospholipase L1-like esterase